MGKREKGDDKKISFNNSVLVKNNKVNQNKDRNMKGRIRIVMPCRHQNVCWRFERSFLFNKQLKAFRCFGAGKFSPHFECIEILPFCEMSMLRYMSAEFGYEMRAVSLCIIDSKALQAHI